MAASTAEGDGTGGVMTGGVTTGWVTTGWVTGPGFAGLVGERSGDVFIASRLGKNLRRMLGGLRHRGKASEQVVGVRAEHEAQAEVSAAGAGELRDELRGPLAGAISQRVAS